MDKKRVRDIRHSLQIVKEKERVGSFDAVEKNQAIETALQSLRLSIESLMDGTIFNVASLEEDFAALEKRIKKIEDNYVPQPETRNMRQDVKTSFERVNARLLRLEASLRK